MRTARECHGSYMFEQIKSDIVHPCGWLSVSNMIKMSSLKLIHKLLYTQVPTKVHKFFKIPRRSTTNISVIYFLMPWSVKDAQVRIAHIYSSGATAHYKRNCTLFISPIQQVPTLKEDTSRLDDQRMRMTNLVRPSVHD